MKFISILVILVFLINPASLKAQTYLNSKESAELLSHEDAFTSLLNTHNLNIRLRKVTDSSRVKYFENLKNSTLDWHDEEVNQLNKIFKILYLELKLDEFPDFNVIKTNGEDEFFAPYARQNSIILPQYLFEFRTLPSKLLSTVAHELIHILSFKGIPDRHETMKVFGFKKLEFDIVPELLLEGLIVNPDNFDLYNYSISVECESCFSKKIDVVPFLTHKIPYKKEAPLFVQTEVKLYVLNQLENKVVDHDKTNYKKIMTKHLSENEAKYENSALWYHPEEVHAENFARYISEKYSNFKMKAIAESYQHNIFNIVIKGLIHDSISKELIKKKLSNLIDTFGIEFSLPENISIYIKGDEFSGSTSNGKINLGRWDEGIFTHEFGHLLMEGIGFHGVVDHPNLRLRQFSTSIMETYADLVAVVISNDLERIEKLLSDTSQLPPHFELGISKTRILRSFKKRAPKELINSADSAYTALAKVKFYLGQKFLVTKKTNIEFLKEVGIAFIKAHDIARENPSIINNNWWDVNQFVIRTIEGM